MVKADVGDNGHFRNRDHIGRVHSAAHANLQHNDVTAVAHEVFKGDTADKLKLCGAFFHGLGQRFDPLGDFCQLLIGDLLTVDLHTLIKAVDIRRGIKTCLITGFLQDRGCHGGSRAFAVCTGNVDIFQLFMGVAHQLQELLGSA